MHENIDRQLKSDILRCFGDLVLGLKEYAAMYLETVITISNSCFAAILKYLGNSKMI